MIMIYDCKRILLLEQQILTQKIKKYTTLNILVLTYYTELSGRVPNEISHLFRASLLDYFGSCPTASIFRRNDFLMI